MLNLKKEQRGSFVSYLIRNTFSLIDDHLSNGLN